nr:hypothetical protein [Tanacetum cinerariifolium]
MVSAVDGGEDVGGAGGEGWLVTGFVVLPEKCAAPEELAGRWEGTDVFKVLLVKTEKLSGMSFYIKLL